MDRRFGGSRPMIAVGVAGATGLVGSTMLGLLAERAFPIRSLRLFASSRSAGSELTACGRTLRVEDLALADPRGLDLMLFSIGATASRKEAPRFAAAGALVVDNSSAFRLDPDIPLLIPEVNPEAVAGWQPAPERRIIAVANCAAINIIMALKPLRDAAGLVRVTAATFQSASGAGQKGLAELEREMRRDLAGTAPESDVFAHPLPFDVLPHIGAFGSDGHTVEEEKIVAETQKILGLPGLRVSVTAVRVPVRVGHSAAVWVETERLLSPAAAREALSRAPGIVVLDDPARGVYPRARLAAGTDPVYVGRIRRDPATPNGLIFWVVGDNVRKGAALNAVQIAEHVLAAQPGGRAEPAAPLPARALGTA
jgi:aspartate-semialdehyde dehydrogenase